MSEKDKLSGSEASDLASIFEAGEPVKDLTPPEADKVMVPTEEPTPTQNKPAGSLGAPEEDPTGEGIELTDTQMSAVDLFKKLRGSAWKTELKAAWITGDYGEGVNSSLWSCLEQVKVLTTGEPKYIGKLLPKRVLESVRLDERTQMLKVLLPDESWDGKKGPEAYEGSTEGVWIAVTDGDKDKGEGVLVNMPVGSAFKGIKLGDVVKYQTLVASMKPMIVDQLGGAERAAGEFGVTPKEPEEPGEFEQPEPEPAEFEQPEPGEPKSREPEEPVEFGEGNLSEEDAVDFAIEHGATAAIERMIKSEPKGD